MDERHWWIAGKIQESFKIGGYDNPTLLEDFMTEQNNLNKINKFLKAGGPCRLFFYCEKLPEGELATSHLHVTGTLASLKDANLDQLNVLYFLRNRVDKDVDPTRMERDIFCGELKHNTMETLTSLLSEVYIPLIKAQKEWGECNNESQNNLTHSMDKFLTALNESTASMASSKQLMLKQPENVILNDFKMQRQAALDTQLIGQYEELVTDWMNTIETILSDTSDERFMDPNAGPLSELERWRRRQRLLTSITEQLKSKECKAVIGVLITAKSRLLKKWKVVDASITDAMNDTKDKVKYLESLRRHFDQLYHDATPASIINNAIPGITNSVRQMDSISRYYARTGFLGIVFTKITNQLVLACKEYIRNFTSNVYDEDELWGRIAEEIKHRELLSTVDPQQRLLRSQVESKLKGGMQRSKTKEGKDLGLQDDSLYGRLRACLSLQGFYRDTLRSLKDALGQSQNLSHFPSISSMGGLGSVKSKPGTSDKSRGSSLMVSPKKGISALDTQGHGVSIADDDAVMSHMDSFCTRIKQLIDVINTLSQYNKMVTLTAGMPRLRKDDFVFEDETEKEEYKYRKRQQEARKALEREAAEQEEAMNAENSPERSLGTIAEDEDTPNSEGSKTDERKEEGITARNDEVFDSKDKDNNQGLNEEQLAVLRKYYPEDEEDDGPGVSAVILDHLDQMTKAMSDNVTTKTMLDVESKDRDRFDMYYNNFAEIVQEQEKLLSAYLNVIFMRKMKTQQGLDIITRFGPVQGRPGIRTTIAEKFVEIFNWYETDLEEVQRIYETHKESPQMVRNAPPAAGAIHWSRQLLKRIEDPMKVFRDNRAINQLGDFSRIVKIYNRLATALVTFESLWFAQWKNRIEHAKAGLRATLFINHPNTGEILVNTDERVLELIHEAKWLTRLGIQIPDSATAIMQQESRFKSYKSHLELVLHEYKETCKCIPESLQNLFTPHTKYVEEQLQPGLTTLAWNSMNIDAFLHQIHSATNRLKERSTKVQDIMENDVAGSLEAIKNFYLFDYEEAITRPWPPHEFRDVMLDRVQEKVEELQKLVQRVMNGLLAVANLLATRKLEHHNPKAKKLALMVDDSEAMKERQRAAEEEKYISNLISFYKEQVYEAVLTATKRSLSALVDSTSCSEEELRAASVLSNPTYSPNTSPRRTSRAASAMSRVSSAMTERPNTSMSALSNMTWTTEKTNDLTYLQFEIEVGFNIPVIAVQPTLDTAQTAINDVASAVVESCRDVTWVEKDRVYDFHDRITSDAEVNQMLTQLTHIVHDVEPVINKHIFHFSYYDFLWKDDLHGNFKEFMQSDPGMFAIKREVERYLYIEKKVLAIPEILPVGPICLKTDPIKDALHGFAMQWKSHFASVLHEEAKKKLDSAVLYRSNVRNRLELDVITLDQLNSALHLLEELRDMENKIDGIYLPIETMYAKLREFELRLPRNEVEEVDQLRDKWQELMELAEEVRHKLLIEKRGTFEQELDKQVKSFNVEVLRFRNDFDGQGPMVPGIPPSEAVSRLDFFQQSYVLFDLKRKTLDSVSKLFGIICKPFIELDKTGEELHLLNQLYGLFQKFIRFDNRFKDTLWADVDLEAAHIEVEGYWDECLALPSKLKDKDAYNDLKTSLQTYLEVFPLLKALNSKEIRNRHWSRVMFVTHSSFPLEANVFKLKHLLEIELIKHKTEIEEICHGAARELELEIKMKVTEEEWTEQVLAFEHYKKRGPMYLDKAFTERLLEQLEDSQALLANMLTSKYIAPLRTETASLAVKLKEVAEVLELWLEVQDLWQYLEAVFTNVAAARELPQEAKRFTRVDKTWMKLMKKAFDTRNVLQCCHGGGEGSKVLHYKIIYDELEICFKSLMVYLDNKRRAFPRFYFVSDPILLSILSRPADMESVRPHLRSLFSSISDVKLEEANPPEDELPTDEIGFGKAADGHRTSASSRAGGKSMLSPSLRSTTPPKIDKRLTEHYSKDEVSAPTTSETKKSLNPSVMQHGPSYLPSEGIIEDVILYEATAISSSEGETIALKDKVKLADGVEVWLLGLSESAAKTIKEMNNSIIQDCNQGTVMDEWASKYPAQVCKIGMLYFWTKECEIGISEIKYDRKALHGALKRYSIHTSKLTSVLMRGAWRTIEEPMLPVHKSRLECMVAQSLYLRDVLENMCNRKLRESTDFEWRRSVRCYYHPVATEADDLKSTMGEDTASQTSLTDLHIKEEYEPLIWILDSSYHYSNEFYGAEPGVALTPVTERCFLTMSQAINNVQGSHIVGPGGVGKTETVKGLANLFGKFLMLVQCSPESDTSGMGKIVQGTAMDGCWACFDESQNLNNLSMSIVLDFVTSVLSALKSRHSYASLSNGQEINLKKGLALHMTSNASVRHPSCRMPNYVSAIFRTVSLVKPDYCLVLKAKCASHGFKVPNILGVRLKTLSDLTINQLPPEVHHLFGIATWAGVLKKAAIKKRLVKDDKYQDKIDARREETSRSESQASDNVAQIKAGNPMSQQMSVTMAPSSMKFGGAMTATQRKMGTPNPMTLAAKMEHSLVCQTIREVICPRMTDENNKVFKNILDDVFTGLPDAPQLKNTHSARSRGIDIELALKHKAVDKGLSAHDPWISRCKQLYEISQVYHGVIVAGPPGSGKTSCIQTLVDALSTQVRGGQSRQSHISRTSNPAESQHKIIRINPMVVDEYSIMFGYLKDNHDWVDGIVTSSCRKANRNQSTTWLCLDGPLNPGWSDNFNSVLSEEKVIHLKNGDKLFLSENIIVVFETDNLSSASPSTISKSGIVYLGNNVVGWKPIADAWLESRSPQEIHRPVNVEQGETDQSLPRTVEGVLQRAFQKTLDPISQFVLNEAKPLVKLSLVGLFKSCLGLLSAMLADNRETSEDHVERLFLFCLIWTFGGLLDSHDRKIFSEKLKMLSNTLPDDDRQICVFDYYVDESGDWDPWASKVSESVYSDQQDMLGEVFVDSINTIRTKILIDFASASGLNVLLVGPHGSGKTTLINDFMDLQEKGKQLMLLSKNNPQISVCKKLVFSGASSAKQLQSFIESNIYHRQGFVYGAKENKKLKVFIDDVNLPLPDNYKVQKCNELLRQLLDDKTLCTLEKPFEWKTVEGFNVIGAMSMSDNPGVSCTQLSERLLRHFAVFHLTAPEGEALKNIVHGILDLNMTDGDRPGLDIELHNHLVKASCDMLKAVQDVLKSTAMPGRKHYLYTLKDITTCFQCLKRLPEESRADETLIPVISLWKHEMTRIMRDRIARTADLNWFDQTINNILAENFPEVKGPFMDHFVTFPTDARMYNRPVTSVTGKNVRISLQPVDNLRDIHSCLNTHLTRYNEEFGNIPLNIMLSDFIIDHVVRMHRVLSFHHGGNLLLIGAVGAHLTTLCRLALHVADIPIHKMDTSKTSNFFDGLRSAVRLSGAENKILTVIFTARDLQDPVYLDAINSLLISGEVPHLFTNDEMEGLLQAIAPAMKREFPSMSVDPMKFFVARVKSNLHIILCLQPGHILLGTAHREFPGLLSGCAIDWMCDWPQESLLGEASYFITRFQLTEEFENLSESITTCLANIHSFVLRDCRQLPWAGDLSPEITINKIKVLEKKKEQFKVEAVKVPNLPYSKTILHERIKNRHRKDDDRAKNEVYVGPTTFRRFMECFRCLYNNKSKVRTQDVEQLKKVLSTLDQTRSDAKVMRKAIKTISGKFQDATKKTEDLLYKLTVKATALEKLKAKIGLSKSLDAHLHLTEMYAEEEEEDELLEQEEYDEYDRKFDKMMELKLQDRQVKAKEDHVKAKKSVDECRQNLEYAKQQVLHWKTKVDRGCIERIRQFSNPPLLVGQVMEMVMMLVGKRLPSQRLYEPKESTGKDEMSSRMSSSSSSTKMLGVKKGKKDGGFDRAQWKNIQMTMNDSQKFVDMLHNVPWEDGLMDDVLRAVESYLSANKDGNLGVTGEGTLLDHAQDVQFTARKRSPSPDNTKGITIAAAKYSSEDCATLVQYTIAIVEFSRLCGPLKAALENLHGLEREIEENERLQKEKEEERRLKKLLMKEQGEEETKRDATPEPEQEYTADDLSKLQDDVNNLQQQFDQSVTEKHNLETELTSMNQRLKAATDLIDSMYGQELEWRKFVKENDSNDLLLANCITAAAFLVYCGSANMDTRKRMGEFFMQVCEHHGMPMPNGKLFKELTLVDFLCKKLDLMELEIKQLPTTPLMLENAAFLMQEDYVNAWPLICDPTSRVLDWLYQYKRDKGLVVVRYSEIRSQFENCLADGSPLFITDCDLAELSNDKRFIDALQNCSQFIHGKTRFKITVEDHEVECDPKFRLFLHTTVEPHNVPQTLAAYCTVLYFQQSRHCLEVELMERFKAKKEKSRSEEERQALRVEKKENMIEMERLEFRLRENLSSDVRLMNDLPATKKMTDLKKMYDEAVDSQSRVEERQGELTKNTDTNRNVAVRAAVCFDVAQYMREVNALYQISFTQFLTLFDYAITQSEPSQDQAMIDKITYTTHNFVARGLMERDRHLFSLLLAIEVEDSLGNVGVGEREFLISPNYGSVVMSALGYTQPTDSKILQQKNTFAWMHEEQFHNLQVLATHFEWFQDMFDKMPKDGRESPWRNFADPQITVAGETQPLPDKFDEHCKNLQWLCVMRAARSDRLMQASTLFINRVLGKKSAYLRNRRPTLNKFTHYLFTYYGDVGIDFTTMHRQSSPNTPVLLLYQFETEMAYKVFIDYANKKQNKPVIKTLTENTAATEKAVKRIIQKGMNEGSWVLLNNAHNAPNVLKSLETVMTENPKPDHNFRVWITCRIKPDYIPTRMLQNSVKCVIDSPRVMKDSLIRSFNCFDSDILKQSSRQEWAPMLHNLCYVHAAIQLRARFGMSGWNGPKDFSKIGYTELMESLSILVSEFKDPLSCIAPDGSQMSRPTSWTGLRYMMSEIIYGSHITDSYDQQAVSALVDYWLSPNAVKKDFEERRLKYKHPAAFFNPNVRLNTLIQALEYNISPHTLDVPEGCHIHPSVETLLGDDQYVFTRLNKVFDAMPSNKSLQHKMFPRPPTPFDGPALAGISKYSNNPCVVNMGVFSTASFSLLKLRKDVELWEICTSLLQKVPKILTKDFVTERIKKAGETVRLGEPTKVPEFPNINTFIMKEIEMMSALGLEIRNTLTAIKNACETESFGDNLSEHIVSAADDLYHMRIPKTWCQMAGSAAPPLTMSVAAWLSGDRDRDGLLARSMALEKLIGLPRSKVPVWTLGQFFRPQALIAILKQDYIRNHCGDRSGYFDQIVVNSDITPRDVGHIREPPVEGMYVYGIHLWGCAWDKTVLELMDSPPKQACVALPVVHLTCCQITDKANQQDPSKAAEIYSCPVYASRISAREPIFEMEVKKEGISSYRWALRGLSATIRNY
ncbi:uncharacterized protein LOC127725852 isoform X10 [Mytilus californianus]|uniref:uncharacterized protein LOC127725852 isoform X10 n=1 Tax=Mytilus californianus TaxID=6549 RepID=UPI002246C297|nr:uncharacterized protein LOC127725852 isoform X10 [Mytilus californianus]